MPFLLWVVMRRPHEEYGKVDCVCVCVSFQAVNAQRLQYDENLQLS